ncbi:hypothetical protein [Acinetobacter colistiniresistens]|uniref:hypothetical protein n=1 Tax=Acinetobacter colistiniresistens TaxID=280145 RepID=UPI001250BA45|nr:hypothetical protein [Acinetobacter colistiniresistens]
MANITGKKETVLRSFPVPTHFKQLLTTIVVNHPDYKNITDFVIQCYETGLKEILVDLNELPADEFYIPDPQNHLSNNYAKELKDFLKKYSIEDLLAEKCETVISWNMKESFFLQLKSKVPLSQYKELKVFYFAQVYKGLQRLVR